MCVARTFIYFFFTRRQLPGLDGVAEICPRERLRQERQVAASFSRKASRVSWERAISRTSASCTAV